MTKYKRRFQELSARRSVFRGKSKRRDLVVLRKKRKSNMKRRTGKIGKSIGMFLVDMDGEGVHRSIQRTVNNRAGFNSRHRRERRRSKCLTGEKHGAVATAKSPATFGLAKI